MEEYVIAVESGKSYLSIHFYFVSGGENMQFDTVYKTELHSCQVFTLCGLAINLF